MKEENQNGKERQMAEEQIDFRTLLFKYIIHWPPPGSRPPGDTPCR